MANLMSQNKSKFPAIQIPCQCRIEPDMVHHIRCGKSRKSQSRNKFHLKKQIAPERMHFQHLHPQGGQPFADSRHSKKPSFLKYGAGKNARRRRFAFPIVAFRGKECKCGPGGRKKFTKYSAKRCFGH